MSESGEHEVALDTFRRAVTSTAAAFESLRVHLPAPIAGVEGVVESLIGQLKTSDSLLVPLLSAGAEETSPAHTAVNVSILALRIGLELQYSHPDLSQLGQVALLHDIGRIGTPATRLGIEQGAKLIRTLGPAYVQVANLVVQAHERVHGRGGDGDAAPRAHEHVQIVSLAATYERLSRQQPKGPRAWPPAPVKEILRRERARFPDDILKALIQIMVTFPVGSFVRLNSGEVACVVAKNDRFPLRPIVSIPSRGGGSSAEAKLIDLRDNPFLYVKEFLGHEGHELGGAST